MKIILFVLMLSSLMFGDEFCIIVEDEAIVTQHHGNTIIINIPQKFGYGFIVGKKNKNFVEIVKKPNSTIGWIDKKYIQCSSNLGSSTPYIDGVKVKTTDGNESMLYKKAFITNSVFKVTGKMTTMKNLPRYLSSTSTVKSGQKSNLYEIYFILQETSNRLLLSKVSSIYSESYQNNVMKNIIGWVEKKHLKIWNSRVAIEPKVKNLSAYWDPEFKYKYDEVVTKPKKHFSLRYPELNKVSNGIRISYMQKEGAYGYMRDTMAKVLAQKKPHIVFLIDATVGMQYYMDNVRGGIIDYLNNKSDIKVAVALYRDYSDENDKYRLLTKGFLSPTQAINSMEDTYFKAKSTNDGLQSFYKGKRVDLDRSKSEALFNGIISLYEDKNLKLDDFATPTRVILIGDHGNHRKDDKGYTADKVADIVKNKIVINAIQVHTDGTVNKPYVTNFQNDIRSINKLRGLGSLIIDNKGSRQTIKKAIISSANEVIKVRKTIQQVIGGNTLTQQQKELLSKELKIDVDNLGKVQQSLELYINNKETKNYKRMILAQSEFVDELASAYTTMARTIAKYTNSNESLIMLKDGLGKAIRALTGQEINKHQNVAEFLEEKLKIPKSKILDLTFDDWIDKVAKNPNEYRAKRIREFRKKSVLLKALTAEKIYENIKFNQQNQITYDEKKDGNGNVVVRKTKFNISVVDNYEGYDTKSKYNANWIWVPFEYLP